MHYGNWAYNHHNLPNHNTVFQCFNVIIHSAYFDQLASSTQGANCQRSKKAINLMKIPHKTALQLIPQ